ncbi:response regulator [bacterium]|nr:response regulator [bacterium]
MAHILVVDDNPGIRKLLVTALRVAGYDVSEASDGSEALDRMRAQKADLVIADILMPSKDGVEMIKEVRSEHPEVPVIAISGGGIIAAATYLSWAEQIGADRIFEKPFSVADLLGAVKDLLEKHGHREET